MLDPCCRVVCRSRLSLLFITSVSGFNIYVSTCDLIICCTFVFFFFFQAEDGIRDLVRSRGLGDVYKRQDQCKICGGF